MKTPLITLVFLAFASCGGPSIPRPETFQSVDLGTALVAQSSRIVVSEQALAFLESLRDKRFIVKPHRLEPTTRMAVEIGDDSGLELLEIWPITGVDDLPIGTEIALRLSPDTLTKGFFTCARGFDERQFFGVIIASKLDSV